ncbi:transposase [Streptomyces sp. NPDC048508]|uniref:transposase n=1 Tax=Streptomyces sp. NPDC048508 TaxID=3365561 RepID=UPI00371B83AA
MDRVRHLLIAAHQQLDGPIVLVWDNLKVHKDRRMRAFIDAHDWIGAYHLSPYAPDFNPMESIWSTLRRTCQANTAFTDPEHLIRRLDTGSAGSSSTLTCAAEPTRARGRG